MVQDAGQYARRKLWRRPKGWKKEWSCEQRRSDLPEEGAKKERLKTPLNPLVERV